MPPSLEEVQDEILDRVHAGEAIDEAAILEAHPEHAADLRAFFNVIALVEGSPDEAGLPPARLGEFRILQELGRGGMGVVYEAEQTSLKRRVALKVLPPQLRMDTGLLKRFQREAEAAGRLRHPGIVPVFAVGEATGTPFFAMELVEGTTLQKVLAARRGGTADAVPGGADDWQTWAVETIARVADALAYAHDQGILHRDVKPANILLDAEGSPRLTDFGLAQDLRSPGLTQTGEVFGSPQYMSPEQAVRKEAPVDERTDVYSLAVTLYEALTQRLPYDGKTNAELLTALAAGRVLAPRRANPDISKALEGVLLRALRTKPQERYRNAAAFAADLRAALAGAPTASREPLLSSGRAKLVLGAAAVVLIALAAWWAYPDPRSGDDATDQQLHATDGGREPQTTDSGRSGARGDDAGAVEEVVARFELASPRTEKDYRRAIGELRWRKSSVAQLALGKIYEAYIAGPGKNDAEARAALDYVEYEHEVPEEIAFRRFDYVRAVEKARAQRWFRPQQHEKDDWELAQRAWAETKDHVHRLAADHEFRAMDRVLAGMANGDRLANHYLSVRYAKPFVICFASREHLSPYDALDMDPGPHRTEAMLRAKERAERVQAVLDEKARIVQQVHAELLRRYGTKLGLKSLTDPYGGRPDYPTAARSFADGCPLLVWIFDSQKAFRDYHAKQRSSLVPRQIVGYFDPRSGAILLQDSTTTGEQRAFEIRKCANEAAHQLIYWFTRQQNRWRKPRPSQSWFGVGWTQYFGAVELHNDGKLRFRGVDPARLKNMQLLARSLKGQGKEYPLFPLEKLTAFKSFAEVQAWGTNKWQLHPSLVLSLFLQQSWALAHFLNEGAARVNKDDFTKLLELTLRREPAEQVFAQAYGIPPGHGDTWEPMDAAFEKHVRAKLMKLDPKTYEHTPPPLGSLLGK